jgi:hypothetical protein
LGAHPERFFHPSIRAHIERFFHPSIGGTSIEVLPSRHQGHIHRERFFHPSIWAISRVFFSTQHLERLSMPASRAHLERFFHPSIGGTSIDRFFNQGHTK